MPLATGPVLGVPSPFQLAATIVNLKIAQSKADALNDKGGLGVPTYSKIPDYGYSSNRGIICEKKFVDVPERILLFQFNPEIITDDKSNNYETKSHTGFTSVDTPWINGGERVLSFELNFEASAGANTPLFNKGRDTSRMYGKPTVQTLDDFFPNGTMDDIDILRGFMYPEVEDPTAVRFTKGGHIPTPKFKSPPTLIFCYGSIYLEGTLTDCKIEHSMWNSKLTPIRSKATIAFRVNESYVAEVQPILANKAKFSSGPSIAGGYKQTSMF
jgi:hypothetical protein